MIERSAYEAADQKPNRAKLARDTQSGLINAGVPPEEIQSRSTIKRRTREIEARDRSFFAFQRHGREGKWTLEVQKGELEVERPLEITFRRCRYNDPMLAALRDAGIKQTPKTRVAQLYPRSSRGCTGAG